jgi:predicted RNA methylase
MTMKEIELFQSFVMNANSYVEFGCGYSTLMAALYVKNKIISVDSSKEWINLTRKQCEGNLIKPEFCFVDIGEVGDWGTPSNENEKEKWPNYHSNIWGFHGSWGADLYFIDGRFRVACFAQIYRRCDIQSIIGIHDFKSREKHYGVIRELGREIASAYDISFFLPIPDKMPRSQEIIDEYKYNYR